MDQSLKKQKHKKRELPSRYLWRDGKSHIFIELVGGNIKRYRAMNIHKRCACRDPTVVFEERVSQNQFNTQSEAEKSEGANT